MVKIGNALRSEIEKVALSGKTLASFSRKRAVQNAVLERANNVLGGGKAVPHTDGIAARWLNIDRNTINEAITRSKKAMDPKEIREYAQYTARQHGIDMRRLTKSMKNPNQRLQYRP